MAHLLDSGIETIPEAFDGTREEFIALEGQFVPRTTIDRFKRGNPFGDDPTRAAATARLKAGVPLLPVSGGQLRVG